MTRARAAVGAVLLSVVLGLALVACGSSKPGPCTAKGTPFTAPVVDQAGVVPDAVEQQVDAELNSYQARSTNQIAVAVLKTTGSKSVEDCAVDLFRAWGVGQKGKDNGVLLLIANNDHKLRIEVGYGLEGTLTDLQSGRIVNDRLVPLLRNGDLGGAVEQGTQAIRQALGDDVTLAPTPTTAPGPPAGSGSSGSSFAALLPLLIIAVIVFSSMGGRRRRRRGIFPFPIFWGGGWGGGGFGGGGWGGGGGGGGGFGGGGFGGGGGGSSGGGGASGSW